MEDDQYTWLVTFSDLVLQLFGFVILGLVATRATAPLAAPAAAAAEAVAAVIEAAEPAPQETAAVAPIDAAEVRAAVALVDGAIAPRTPAAAEPAPAAPRHGSVTALDTQLAAIVAAHAGDEGLRVTVQDSSVVFTLEDGIAFTSASAELLPGAAPILAEIRRLAVSLPQFMVDVAGHTDDVPIHTAAFPSNLELSLVRAARVARDIAGGDATLRGRTVARGWGEYRPITPNADATGRARNRRVEIRLVPSDAG